MRGSKVKRLRHAFTKTTGRSPRKAHPAYASSEWRSLKRWSADGFDVTEDPTIIAAASKAIHHSRSVVRQDAERIEGAPPK